jgi:uncharacterized membrane protein
MREWNDEQVERIIGSLLRAGVLGSATIVALGGALYLMQHGSEPSDYRKFQGVAPELCGVGGILRGCIREQGRALIQLGLLLLILTPVARVAFSVAAFALERDWTYVAITLIVLAVLIYSLAGRL